MAVDMTIKFENYFEQRNNYKLEINTNKKMDVTEYHELLVSLQQIANHFNDYFEKVRLEEAKEQEKKGGGSRNS